MCTERERERDWVLADEPFIQNVCLFLTTSIMYQVIVMWCCFPPTQADRKSGHRLTACESQLWARLERRRPWVTQYIYIYIYMYLCTYIYIYIYIYICICIATWQNGSSVFKRSTHDFQEVKQVHIPNALGIKTHMIWTLEGRESVVVRGRGAPARSSWSSPCTSRGACGFFYNVYIPYIYIYIHRERDIDIKTERERERERYDCCV